MVFERLDTGLRQIQHLRVQVAFRPQDFLQGIHLISHAIYRTLEQGGQFVLLGTGHADGDFRHIQDHDLKDHKDARMMLMYSEQLAHMIYAAADIVLVPSLFEPCGKPPPSPLYAVGHNYIHNARNSLAFEILGVQTTDHRP